MKPLDAFAREDWRVCHWRGRDETFRHLATTRQRTQSQAVVKPLHWYVACRLVLEGGFFPDEIKPRPPFRAERRGKRWLLRFDQAAARGSEATILGGLKTKDVDVVVEKRGIGPVVAISCKTTGNAFRNLTNRMEEAVGECTNLHMTYPALVVGYLSVFRAHRRADWPERPDNDIAIEADGAPVDSIVRYHEAFRRLEGRADLRNAISRYEAVSLILVETSGENTGGPLEGYPPPGSPLRFEKFFDTVYRRYDERFVLAAPIFETRNVTPRVAWDEASPVFGGEAPALDYEIRASAG